MIKVKQYKKDLSQREIYKESYKKFLKLGNDFSKFVSMRNMCKGYLEIRMNSKIQKGQTEVVQ